MILRTTAFLLCFVMSRGSGQSFFWNDGTSMGVVPEAQHINDSDPSVPELLPQAAAIVLMNILQERGAASGDEELVYARANVMQGSSVHVRYRESIRGIAVDMTSLIVHIRTTDGVVYAVNGEFVNSKDVAYPTDDEPGLDCETATRMALVESGIENGEWASPNSNDEDDEDSEDGENSTGSRRRCGTKAIATDSRGRSHLCWKRSVRYGSIQRDLLYASVMTGELVARVPQVMTASGSGGGGGGGGMAGGFTGGIR